MRRTGLRRVDRGTAPACLAAAGRVASRVGEGGEGERPPLPGSSARRGTIPTRLLQPQALLLPALL